jgi:hypothetical protein
MRRSALIVAAGALVAACLPARGSAAPVTPHEIQVITVPRLAGVRFTVGGQPFVSGRDGIARARVRNAGHHLLRVASVAGGTSFGRWRDGRTASSRTVWLVGRNSRFEAGFVVTRRTTFSFVAPDGSRVAPGRITRIDLATNGGGRVSFRGVGSRLLPTQHAVLRGSHLRAADIHYAVERVLVAGSNVVNRGQQRFTPADAAHVQIDVLFFSVGVSVRDAFFPFAQGSTLRLQYPDGRVQVRPLRDGKATFAGLPRGDYEITIGARGLGTRHQVVVSRDQRITLKVLSYYDLGAALGAFALASLALFALGRGGRRRRRHGALGRLSAR